ncbi:ornithine carbamoyltransferase [Thoreauomyces humboldtii]|nr:ornithine carbamoyltransferase [Thoreauomyces humboldtii]
MIALNLRCSSFRAAPIATSALSALLVGPSLRAGGASCQTESCFSISRHRHSSTSSSSVVSFHGVKHLLTLRDLSPVQILALVRRSLELKQELEASSSSRPDSKALAGKTLAMIFAKRSTRTRVSAETGWAHYGGHPMFLGREDIQIGGGEPLKDTAIVVSSMVDAILARVGAHEEVETLAANSSVPIINALTQRYHPLQALADIMTLYETSIPHCLSHPATPDHPLPSLPPLKVAWVGDANNIIHSLLVSLPRIADSLHLSVATPVGYNCDADIMEYATREKASGSVVSFTRDPSVAVKDADIIVTDTWVSMGQENEKAKRLKDFEGYMISEVMARKGGAKPDWKFMHCLPRKPEEVDDEVFYNPARSIVFQEAENRKYTVMAVYEMLMLWTKK